MSSRFLFASLFVISLVCVAHAQGGLTSHPVLPDSTDDDSRHQNLSEIRARNAIKREEAIHAEMLGRAREVAKLGTELRATFENAKRLATDDLKKLARMEKLTRKIRSDAGGAGDGEPSKDLPDDTQGAIARLAELSGELRARVEKTPRHVVSATVVERANQLLELIERIRRTSK